MSTKLATKRVRLLATVTWNGAEVIAGEELELHDKNAESLVASGIAEALPTKRNTASE